MLVRVFPLARERMERCEQVWEKNLGQGLSFRRERVEGVGRSGSSIDLTDIGHG